MISLFASPVKGILWDGSDPEGTPVNIIGLRVVADGTTIAVYVDGDAVLHESEARLLDFTALAP